MVLTHSHVKNDVKVRGEWALVGPPGSHAGFSRFQDTSLSEQFADFADQFKTASVAGAVPWSQCNGTTGGNLTGILGILGPPR